MITDYINETLGKIINRFRVKSWECLTNFINDNSIKSYCEVGVWDGNTSKYINNHTNLEKIILVDNYINNNYLHPSNRIALAKRRSAALAKLPHVIFIYKDSIEAAKEVADNSIDFIWIDADHSYKGCKADIKAWLPKVKKDGWIGGHNFEIRWFGVMRAVDELFYHYTLHYASIWICKKSEAINE